MEFTGDGRRGGEEEWRERDGRSFANRTNGLRDGEDE